METRNYWITDKIEFVAEHKWPGLVSIGIAETILEYPNGKVSKERRLFITSIPADAKLFGRAVRGHWGVEAFHWTLDMTFREDESRIRIGNGPQNFAVLRQISLNLLKAAKEKDISIRRMRKKSGWDNRFLMKVLLARGF